jgi:alpha-mannosidase
MKAGRANVPFEAGSGQGAGESGFSRASGGGNRFRPVMIYNPCAWTRSEMVEVNLYDLPEDIKESDIVALDETGNAHPTLPITSIAGGNHDWGHRRMTVMFYAKDVPTLGYRTFLFGEGSPSAEFTEVKTVDEVTVETPHIRFAFDKFHGGVCNVRDTASDRSLSYHPFALGTWQYVTEWPTGMSAWLLGGNRGKVSAVLKQNRRSLESADFRVIGSKRNVATDLRTGSSFALVATQQLKVPETRSSVRLRTIVTADQPRVDFVADIDWREIGDGERGIPGLQIDSHSWDIGISSLYETPFGTVSRDEEFSGNEVPSLRFAHFSSAGKEQGLDHFSGAITLLQDCKYGHSARSTSVNLRVLRSTYDPDHAPEVAKSTMRYALVFHDTEPTKAELVRLGAAFNHPFIVMPVLIQEGKQPTKKGFAEVKTESVVLSTMKRAEKSDGLVVRLVNYADQDVEAVVEFDPGLVAKFKNATLADLMERPISGSVSFKKSKLQVAIKAHSFATVVLT